MALLMPWWNAQQMAIVDAVGSPSCLSGTRSHFQEEEEEVWERCGTQETTPTGWIGRHLATSTDSSGNLAGISHEQRIWSAMPGYSKSLAISNVNNFDVFGYSDRSAARSVLNAISAGSGVVQNEGQDTLNAVNTINGIDFGSLNLENGAVYPNNNSLAREFEQISQLIRANVGLRSVAVDIGG
jgi:uncharacterized protein (DUF1501 family)